MTLQADEEFLLSLYERPTKTKAPLDPEFVRRGAEAMLATGRFSSRDAAEQAVRDMFNPEKDFRGPKVEMLRQMAEPCLDAAHKWLLDLPVGFLHTEELNGCAVLAPSGGNVLLVDLGVLLHMHLLGRSIMTLTSWGAPQPFCRDHDLIEWFRTIVALAWHAISLDDIHLQRITTWNCPSLGEWDLQSAKFAMNVELFVLLHEYGHIARKHLDPQAAVEKNGLIVLLTNHEQEFEADMFAFERQAATGKADQAALAAATLFRFFDLMEHLRYGESRASETHPSGCDRLARIRASSALTELGKGMIAEVDRVFDKAIEVAPQLQA